MRKKFSYSDLTLGDCEDNHEKVHELEEILVSLFSSHESLFISNKDWENYALLLNNLIGDKKIEFNQYIKRWENRRRQEAEIKKGI